MIRIVLTDEQSKAIAAASEPIDLVDGAGRMLGRVTKPTATASESDLSAEELAEIKRRMASPGPGITTKELLDRLQSGDTA